MTGSGTNSAFCTPIKPLFTEKSKGTRQNSTSTSVRSPSHQFREWIVHHPETLGATPFEPIYNLESPTSKDRVGTIVPKCPTTGKWPQHIQVFLDKVAISWDIEGISFMFPLQPHLTWLSPKISPSIVSGKPHQPIIARKTTWLSPQIYGLFHR